MTTYRYKAINTDSFQSLANLIAPCMDVQATFFPLNKTIVISFQGEDASEIKWVADHIDDNALDFQITPVDIDGFETSDLLSQDLNPASLRDIIAREAQCYEDKIDLYATRCDAVEKELETIRQEKADYYNYWMEAVNKKDALRKQIKAVVTLMAPLAE